jgi:hypothetical protein
MPNEPAITSGNMASPEVAMEAAAEWTPRPKCDSAPELAPSRDGIASFS